jgi:hypothetical protein
VEIGTFRVADRESFDLVEPGEGLLVHAAGLAQVRAVGNFAGDLRADAAGPDQSPVRVVVVAAVANSRRGRLRDWPRTPRMRGIASSKGIKGINCVRRVPISDGQRGGQRGDEPGRLAPMRPAPSRPGCHPAWVGVRWLPASAGPKHRPAPTPAANAAHSRHTPPPTLRSPHCGEPAGRAAQALMRSTTSSRWPSRRVYAGSI